MRRAIAGVYALGILLVLQIMPKAEAQPSPARMQKVIANLIESYNNTDSIGYTSYFSVEMMAENTFGEIGKELTSSLKRFGPIESHTAMIDAEGRRALVTVKMTSASFDVHLMLNDIGELERDEWLDHKPDPMTSTGPSAEDEEAAKKRFQPVVAKFIKAVKEQDAELVMTLFAADDEDDWTVEDYRDFLKEMQERRGSIESVGALEVVSANEVLLPIHYERMAMGVYFVFDKNAMVTGLKMTNYAPSESVGVTMADLGEDTLRTTDLTEFLTLQEQFNADSGKTRFIALLSPT